MNEKDKGRLRTFSNIVEVLAIIGKVCLIIAIPFLVLIMVAIPILFKDVKIEEKKISYKDIVALQVDDDNTKIDVIYKGDVVHTEENAQSIIKLFDLIDQNTTGKIVKYIDCEIGIALIQTIIAILVITQVRRLAKNISQGDTPFTLDNVMHLQKIACLSFISFLIPIVVGSILELILGINLNSTFASGNLFEILCVITLVYIFKYGCVLQNKSKITLKD